MVIIMYHDTITGLPVGESFWDFAAKLWDSAANGRFAILALELDFFSKRPYPAILSAFTQRVIRTHDYMLSACRPDENTFFILLDSGLLPFSQMAGRLEADLEEFCLYIKAAYPDMPLSFYGGISIAYDELASIRDCEKPALTAAAMAEACPAARSASIVFFQDALGRNQQESRILPLFEDIMLHHHLVIYLQPGFKLASPAPAGAEALVRIMDADGRLLRPAAFLPVLEKYGVSYQLDLMVLESILRLLREWQKEGLALIPIHINLACDDFLSAEFGHIFHEILEKYEDVRNYIGFEISAADFYANRDYMESAVEELHTLGCAISMDGFGGDTMPLSAFEIPPIDMVKFNRSFLCTGLKNPNNLIIVKKITEMFDACQIPVLCEGIETAAEERFVLSCGIQYVQGFYYGRPVPFDIFQKKYMLPQQMRLSWGKLLV